MPDYQGNSKKDKGLENVPPKKIEKVVITDVVIQKKTIRRKFKELFLGADPRTVAKYVVAESLLPAARNVILDATTKGVERWIYGESAIRRRDFGPGPRITYNTPPSRGYRDSPLRNAPSPSLSPRNARHTRDEFILSSREEADIVLERMNDIIEQYEVASVADLNDLVGLPTTHIDNKWGWIDLRDVQIRQIREGYLIDFPPPEPMQ